MPTPHAADDDQDAQTFPHTITVWGYQERWLAELGLTGRKKTRDANLSGFIQALIDQARIGKVNTDDLLRAQGDRPPGALERAALYMKAKEAGMMFEEDVHAALTAWLDGRRGLAVVKNRIHRSERNVFFADFSLEGKGGQVALSIVCKSSPRPDKLSMALAEAMIGTQTTGKPVLTVCPYFIDDSREALKGFAALGHKCVELGQLKAVLDKLLD